MLADLRRRASEFVDPKAYPGGRYGESDEPFFRTDEGIAYRIVTPKKPSEGIVLYSAGNMEDMDAVRDRVASYAAKYHVAFATWDPMGYGNTAGVPTEENADRGIESVHRALVGRGYDRVSVWGRSIGSVPTCHLASKVKLHAIVLESPIASVAYVRYPWIPWYDLDVFGIIPLNNLRLARETGFSNTKIFVTCNAEDELVPCANSEEIVAALRGVGNVNVQTIEPRAGLGHNDGTNDPVVPILFFE